MTRRPLARGPGTLSGGGNRAREFLSPDEAREIYESLGGIRIRMPAGAYAQRFVKWNMKASDRSFADFLRASDFIDASSHHLLLEIAQLWSRKRVRLTADGFAWSETETVFEALLHVYQLAALYDESGAKMMFRGQRDARWPIVSSRRRRGSGLTNEFSKVLRSRLQTRTHWAFDEQLEAAAQHYGFPTGMIDFTMDADVAGYFATLGGKPGEKGAICLTDATTEGTDVGLVFLPQIFWRIHQQAGIFFVADEFSQPDHVVRFAQAEKTLAIYDHNGASFDPLLDDGPIPRIAEEVHQGIASDSRIIPGERAGYALTERFVQEVLCSWRQANVETNTELTLRIVNSNLDWWKENIHDFVVHCRADTNALSRALMIRECLPKSGASSFFKTWR